MAEVAANPVFQSDSAVDYKARYMTGLQERTALATKILELEALVKQQKLQIDHQVRTALATKPSEVFVKQQNLRIDHLERAIIENPVQIIYEERKPAKAPNKTKRSKISRQESYNEPYKVSRQESIVEEIRTLPASIGPKTIESLKGQELIPWSEMFKKKYYLH